MSSRCRCSLVLGLALGCAASDREQPADGDASTTTSDGGSDIDVDPDATPSSEGGAGTDSTTAATGTITATSTDTGATTSAAESTEAGTTGDGILFADDFDRPDTMQELDNGWIVNVQGGTPPSRFHIDADRAFPFFGEPFQQPLFHAIPSAFRPESFDQSQIRVSADLVTVGGSYDGLVVLFARSQVSSDQIFDTYWCGFLAAAKKLYLGKLTDGVLDAIEISEPDILPLPADSTSRLSFAIDGDELTCEIAGAVEHTLTATDDTFAAGYFGMSGGKPEQNTLRFDDFVLETLD